MIDILTKIVSLLKASGTLTAIVPANNILVGPTDIVQESKTSLTQPQINISTVAESFRTVPTSAKDTMIQIDVWTLNSQLELETIYETIVSILNAQSADTGSTHIFWSLMSNSNDQYESDRRIWHKSITFKLWSI